MQFCIKHRKIIVITTICMICAAAVITPFFMFATSDTFTWEWVEHSYGPEVDECKGTEAHTDHMIIDQEGSKTTIDFYGHYSCPYFEYALTSPGDPSVIENEFFNFTLNTAEQKPHSCDGSGFLFNVNQETDKGYYLMWSSGYFYLTYLNGFMNPNATSYCGGLVDLSPYNGEYWECGTKADYWYMYPWDSRTTIYHKHGCTNNGEYVTGGTACGTLTVDYHGPHEFITKISGGYSNLNEISIQATQDHLVVINNNKVVLDMDLPYETGGCDFGPAVQWARHNCSEESHITFKNVLCGINKYPPTADFNYNLSVADIRQPVIISYRAKDTNIPATALTYLWTVERINEDGTIEKVYPSGTEESSTIVPSNINQWGAGTYLTTLRVKNEYYLFSPTVRKVVQIVQKPSIAIKPDKEENTAGDEVVFKCSEWYNCSTSVSDVVIDNVVSDCLYEPSVFLVGSNGISTTSGNLSAEVEFNYSDETMVKKSDISVPPEGVLISDDENGEKAIKSIKITYKSLPKLAEIKSENYILYTYKTKEQLSDYYSGGVVPRRYEITNSVTCTIQIATGPIKASASSKTSLIEKTVSFSLHGHIDNNGAVTSPPECNTEFLFTGTTLGGETISKYIVVTNGESEIITVPYGNYILSEDSNFAIGYDDIPPMTITIDDEGIIINKKDIIEDGGEIPFVKVLQVATINISRIYESEIGEIISDTDFIVSLTGTPVLKEIKASFEIVSPANDPVYYLDDKSDLILPIGTYMIEEIQSYRLVSLKNISSYNDVLWDRTLNAKLNTEKGKASIAANKNEIIPITLRYISDEYVYDEFYYENDVYFDVEPLNSSGNELTTYNTDLVETDPMRYCYPVTLVNSVTGEDYCGIIKPGEGIDFKYMAAGKYQIIYNNNMYMNFDKLKEINNDNIEFVKEGNQYYLIIPDDYSSGEYEETMLLTDWRGYSDLSNSSTTIPYKTVTHVSFTVEAMDQEKQPVANCEFQFFSSENLDEPLYFVYKYQRWYPATKDTPEAVSTFRTNENGEFNIYKFPVGEYVIKETSPSEDLYSITPIQTLIVDGSRNMGLKMIFTDVSEVENPTAINVTSLKQSIDIGESLQLVNGITPSAASKNISYSSDDENIAVVSPSGLVTGKKVGTTTIKAVSDKDNSIVGTIEVLVYDSQNPEMTSLRQTISNIKLEIGESYTASVTYSPSNVKSPSITWQSADPSIATVSSDGTITGESVGTTDITATVGSLSATCRVTIGRTLIPVQTITFDRSIVTLIYNDKNLSNDRVNVSVAPENASDPTVTFVSSDPSIVSVDVDGNITALGSGTVTITATSSNNISQSCVVTSVPIVDNISLNALDFTMMKGNETQIMATLTPSTAYNIGSLTWESQNPDVASIDNTGLITANDIGQTTIIARTSYSGTDDIIAKCNVIVVTDEVIATEIGVFRETAEDIDAQPITETIELAIGGKAEIITEVKPSTTTYPEIEWSYSRSNVVTVGPADPDTYNADCVYNKFTILANGDSGGEVTVTARVKGTNVYTSFDVVVDSPGTGVSLNKEGTQTLVMGVEPSLNIGVDYDNLLSSAKKITWSSSDDNKIKIVPFNEDKEASITALATGTVTLNVEVEFRVGGTFSDSIDINIENPRVDIMVDGSLSNNVSINKGSSQLFVYEPNCSKSSYGNNGCTYNNYDENIISIESVPSKNTTNGWAYQINGLTAGTTTITLTPVNSAFPPAYISVTVSEGT